MFLSIPTNQVFILGSDCVQFFTVSRGKKFCLDCYKPTRASTPRCANCRPPNLCGRCGKKVKGLKAVNTCNKCPPTLCGGCRQPVKSLEAVHTCDWCRDLTPCSDCGLRVGRLRKVGPRTGRCYTCAPLTKGHCRECDRQCLVKFPRCYTCQTAGACITCGKGCPAQYDTCWSCKGAYTHLAL